MKFLRKKIILQISIWSVVAGLMCLNASIGKLSELFPGSNINSLLVEEINKDVKDISGENSGSTDTDTGTFGELDWHVSLAFYLLNIEAKTEKLIISSITLNFGNVHLDRFSPPPEA